MGPYRTSQIKQARSVPVAGPPRKGRSLPATVLTILLAFCLAPAALAQTGRPVPRPTPDIVVPRDAPTIQAAIEAVRAGGAIFVEPGVYREKLTISGKSIRLSGDGHVRLEGPSSRTVDDADLAVGLINYSEGGGGVLEGFALRGGLNGIVGQLPVASREGAAANLIVQDVTIAGTGRGILWRTGGELTVRGARINHIRHNGIVVKASKAKFFNVSISEALGFGILMKDEYSDGCSNSITDVNIINANVGIGVYSSGVCILGGHINLSQKVGIYFEGSAASVDGTKIHHTIATPVPGGWQYGQGILAVLTELQSVVNSKFNFNQGGGVWILGGTAYVAWDDFWCNKIPGTNSLNLVSLPLDSNWLRPGVPASPVSAKFYGDNPANTACGCSDEAGNKCSDSGPPQPPQAVGSLE